MSDLIEGGNLCFNIVLGGFVGGYPTKSDFCKYPVYGFDMSWVSLSGHEVLCKKRENCTSEVK